MTRVAETVAAVAVDRGSLAIFWLGQAGFALKTSSDQLILLDVYLSDMCETTLGLGVMARRLTPPPLEATEIVSGLMVITHAHENHLDTESVAIIAKNAPGVRFAGPA